MPLGREKEKDMHYIDMHCDTLAKGVAYRKKTITVMEQTMVDITRLRQAGAAAQFFAMFVPQKEYHKDYQCWVSVDDTVTEEDFIVQMYEVYQNTLQENADTLAFAQSYEDLQKNQGNGKISAFLTIENGYPVKGKLENLKKYHDMGVGLMTLTWNDPNSFGYPHSKDPEEMKKGLTDFGKEAIEYMNELGMVIDVSHLSDGGFWDVVKYTDRPFVASHSNCRAVCPLLRNLSDEMIRALADRGGVSGVNFCPDLTRLGANHCTAEELAEQVLHFVQVGGEDCVALGTDFDGIGGTVEVDDPTKMELLFDALIRRGMTPRQLDKLAWGNALRVFEDTLR